MERRKSKFGTVFTIVGVIILLYGTLGGFLAVLDVNAATRSPQGLTERRQMITISISCFSVAFLCLAFASVMHHLCEIANSLREMRIALAETLKARE